MDAVTAAAVAEEEAGSRVRTEHGELCVLIAGAGRGFGRWFRLICFCLRARHTADAVAAQDTRARNAICTEQNLGSVIDRAT